MQTLIVLHQIHPSPTTTLHPWSRKLQTVHRHRHRHTQLFPPPRSRQFRGGAKGFSGRSRDVEIGEINTPTKAPKYKNDNDDEIPEVVRNKIISRILFSVGVPLGIGLAILQVFSVINDQGLWTVPKWLPILTTFITFGASTLGIPYGSLSASLDPKEEGTFLGLEQIEKNWNEMWKEQTDRED